MIVSYLRRWGSTFDFLGMRSRAYRNKFPFPNQDPVLEDLARYSYATKSTYHPDPREHARREGRKEVFQRIQNHLNLTPEQLFIIYNHPSVVAKYMEEPDARSNDNHDN